MNCFDTVWGVFTGKFHDTKNTIKRMFIGEKIKKIEDGVNDTYPKIQSINAKIFSEILEDLYKNDHDPGNDGTEHMGYSRKALYFLAGKWLICLYDFDKYYAERIDYALWELWKRRREIYISDETINSENWYPTRPEHSRYMYMRMKK